MDGAALWFPRFMCAGLTHVTSLNIARTRDASCLPLPSHLQGQEELGHITMLTSLRHLSLAGNLWAKGHVHRRYSSCYSDTDDSDDEDVILEYQTKVLDDLSCFRSCAFLDITPYRLGQQGLRNRPKASWLWSWKILTRLQHLPLRELHIGIEAPQPPRPAGSEACEFYKAAQYALAGAPNRLGMALLRGTRGWPSQEEARVLLKSKREL